MTVRVRFAPSPTGYLHVGGARTALFNWLFARKHGGTFVLRIEDTDVERSSAEMVEGILEALRWLGLDWDEGPYYQSQRLALYREAAHALWKRGYAYPCFCDPAVLEQEREAARAQGRPWKYDRRCDRLDRSELARRVQAGHPYALRFRVPEDVTLRFEDGVHGTVEFALRDVEDFVLLRSDGYPTYQLAVVVDDHDMGITHVIRGDDHIANTPKQILIYRAMDWPLPAFAHVPLILGPDRSRLSKRHGAVSVLAYRDEGYLPEALRNYLALLGWYPPDGQEILSLDDMIRLFDLRDVNRANPVFDVQKLQWMNAEYIRRLPDDVLLERLRPFLERRGWWADVQADPATYQRRVGLLKSRARLLSDFLTMGEAFFTEDYSIDPEAAAQRWTDPRLPDLMETLADRLAGLAEFTAPAIEAVVRTSAEQVSMKPAVLIHALRVALTGRTVGPGLFELMEVLGRDTVVRRIRRVLPPMRKQVGKGAAGQ
jgi:glutamyl-tRNA synthetase